jgi:hypothetical protein
MYHSMYDSEVSYGDKCLKLSKMFVEIICLRNTKQQKHHSYNEDYVNHQNNLRIIAATHGKRKIWKHEML